MAEIAFTTAQKAVINDLSSGTYLSKQSTLAANADTTPWTKVFEEFSVFVAGATTFTATVQLAFKDDKSDAFDIDTQTEALRAATYEFTGYAWARVVRTAATGSNPAVTVSYRQD